MCRALVACLWLIWGKAEVCNHEFSRQIPHKLVVPVAELGGLGVTCACEFVVTVVLCHPEQLAETADDEHSA